MPDTNSSDLAAWCQAGGLLAFASAVYWEVRQLRPFILKTIEMLAVLVDRNAAPRELLRDPTSRPVRVPTAPGDE